MTLAALLLLAAGLAPAATITGGDYGNTALHPNSGDVLSGTFTNVSLFEIDAGADVTVAPGVPLVVYAATVTISGTLDASGRGEPGGGGGGNSSSGQNGVDGGASGTGGVGGASTNGGGGGAGGASGGAGSGSSGGSGGSPGYGSTGTVTIPMSADDAFLGSGGGGGGGSANLTGGSGAAGGGSIYIEASSMTLSGAILANGATAAAVADSNAGSHPGGGGGGGGGTILLRITGPFYAAAGSSLSANGGPGGNVSSDFGGTVDPGGGGAGGRVKVFAGAQSQYAPATISASDGQPGGTGGFAGSIDSPGPAAGGSGTSSFGVVPSSATDFSAQSVYVTSIDWTWAATPDFGDGPTLQEYRLFPSTDAPPLTTPMATSSVAGDTVTALTPNTTYSMFVTAYTDWGDSLPSNVVSTHTLADVPALAATVFPSVSAASLTFDWTAGANGNPGYTQYEVDASTSPGFAAPVSTGYVVGLSSAPANLTPNTLYYLRARAINIDGVPTAFTPTASTATLAAQPTSPAFGSVFITSASFVWSADGNPEGTQYLAEISTDNFFTVNAASSTLGLSATFFALTPGTQLYFRVAAVNQDSMTSAFSAVVSTESGNLSNTTPPTAPGTPVADRQYSYDGAAVYSWTAAQSAVGILSYNLLIGSLPGASDFFDGNVSVTSYTATGLPTGRTFYAEVRALSNAGVYGSFSGASAGVTVFNTSQAAPLEQAINWPNPFNPQQGPTQIGFSLGEPATVVLKIYTLNGHLVHEATQDFQAGNQVTTWNGNNDAGSRVAAGGYIAVLQKRYSDHVETQNLKIAVLY